MPPQELPLNKPKENIDSFIESINIYCVQSIVKDRCVLDMLPHNRAYITACFKLPAGLHDFTTEMQLSWLSAHCTILFLNIPKHSLPIISAFVISPKAWTHFAKNKLCVLVMAAQPSSSSVFLSKTSMGHFRRCCCHHFPQWVSEGGRTEGARSRCLAHRATFLYLFYILLILLLVRGTR